MGKWNNGKKRYTTSYTSMSYWRLVNEPSMVSSTSLTHRCLLTSLRCSARPYRHKRLTPTFKTLPDSHCTDLRDLALTATCRHNGFKFTEGLGVGRRASGVGRRASGVGVYSAGKTDTIFSLSLFLPTLFLLAYFHAINFLISTTLILKHPMNLLSFSLNWLQMIKPVEQSIPDPLRQAISLSDKYDTYVETSIRDTIKKGELLLCVGPGRSFL